MNEIIPFPLNRKSVVTGSNKAIVQNIFPQDGKTTSSRKDI